MRFRHVLMAAVVFGVLGGLLALPWFLFARWQAGRSTSNANDASTNSAEGFRYDDKTFEQWRTSWRKELKPERRIDTLRALSALASRGHDKEAAETVMEMVREHCREVGAGRATEEQDRFLAEARTALARIGPASSLALMECMKDSAKDTSPFCSLFKEVDLHPAAVPVVVKMAQSENQERSALALQTLARSLRKSARAAEMETAVREAVKKGKHARGFVDALQRLLADERTRSNAITILGSLGPTAQPAVAALLKAVQKELPRGGRRQAETHADDSVLCLMIEALGKIQSEPGRVLPVLSGIISDRSQETSLRMCAIRAVVQFGPAAMSATDTLIDALDDSIRCEALAALSKLEVGPVWVLPRLLPVIDKEIDNPRTEVVTLKPSLQIPLQGMETDFLQQSLLYLEKVGPQAKDAVPTLAKIFQKVERVRPQVLVVLDKIGPAGRDEARRLSDQTRGGTMAKSQPDFSPRADEVKPVSFPPPADSNWKSTNDPVAVRPVPLPGTAASPPPGKLESGSTFPVVSAPPFEKFPPVPNSQPNLVPPPAAVTQPSAPLQNALPPIPPVPTYANPLPQPPTTPSGSLKLEPPPR